MSVRYSLRAVAAVYGEVEHHTWEIQASSLAGPIRVEGTSRAAGVESEKPPGTAILLRYVQGFL